MQKLMEDQQQIQILKELLWEQDSLGLQLLVTPVALIVAVEKQNSASDRLVGQLLSLKAENISYNLIFTYFRDMYVQYILFKIEVKKKKNLLTS